MHEYGYLIATFIVVFSAIKAWKVTKTIINEDARVLGSRMLLKSDMVKQTWKWLLGAVLSMLVFLVFLTIDHLAEHYEYPFIHEFGYICNASAIITAILFAKGFTMMEKIITIKE
jgi:sensor histidine kinase YesM